MACMRAEHRADLRECASRGPARGKCMERGRALPCTLCEAPRPGRPLWRSSCDGERIRIGCCAVRRTPVCGCHPVPREWPRRGELRSDGRGRHRRGGRVTRYRSPSRRTPVRLSGAERQHRTRAAIAAQRSAILRLDHPHRLQLKHVQGRGGGEVSGGVGGLPGHTDTGLYQLGGARYGHGGGGGVPAGGGVVRRFQYGRKRARGGWEDRGTGTELGRVVLRRWNGLWRARCACCGGPGGGRGGVRVHLQHVHLWPHTRASIATKASECMPPTAD